MLYMLIVKASKNSESANLPNPRLMEAMDRYNEALIEAGVRVMAKGLHPTREALRLSFPVEGGSPVVTQGPFADPSSLVAGFFLLEVESREEAIAWAMRCPDPQGYGEGQIELRQVYE